MKTLKLTSLALVSLIGFSLTVVAASVNASAQTRNNPPSNNSGPSTSSHHVDAVVGDCRQFNNCRRFPSKIRARQECKTGLWEDQQPGFVAEHQYMCTHKQLVPVAD